MRSWDSSLLRMHRAPRHASRGSPEQAAPRNTHDSLAAAIAHVQQRRQSRSNIWSAAEKEETFAWMLWRCKRACQAQRSCC